MKMKLLGISCLVGIGFLLAAEIEPPFAPAFPNKTADNGVARISPRRYADDELIVRFRPAAQLSHRNAIINAFHLQVVETIPQIGVVRLKLPAFQTVENQILALQSCSEIEFVEPNYRIYLADAPNDPYFPYQWAVLNFGQPIAPPDIPFFGGTPGADMKVAEAWELEKGSSSVVVAVVDTGVSLAHPDLVHKLVSSGYDFHDNDANADDEHGHGTLVAGVIGAESENGIGISGICPNCQILPVKVWGKDATGLTSDVIKGIIWAADQGAQVMNMSLGGPDIKTSAAFEAAIAYAFGKDVVMAAAAGNDGTEGVWYPAAYDQYVLAATATDHRDIVQTLATRNGEWGSNFGPEVDVAAPGLHILGPWPEKLSRKLHEGWEGYAYGDKTSLATACTSGAVALIRSYAPALRNTEVMDILRRTADDINAATFPGWDPHAGYGRVNVRRALDYLTEFEPPLDFSGIQLPASFRDSSRGRIFLHWRANPDNEHRALEKYRIYRLDDGERRLVAEVEESMPFVMISNFDRSTPHDFTVVGVNHRGREGKPAETRVDFKR
jgi:subtilisin family serine protease